MRLGNLSVDNEVGSFCIDTILRLAESAPEPFTKLLSGLAAFTLNMLLLMEGCLGLDSTLGTISGISGLGGEFDDVWEVNEEAFSEVDLSSWLEPVFSVLVGEGDLDRRLSDLR